MPGTGGPCRVGRPSLIPIPEVVHNALLTMARRRKADEGALVSIIISESAVGEPTSRGQLLAAGFSDDEIACAAASGALTRLYRGVYARGPDASGNRRPLEMLRIIGVANRSPSMVVSHASAAVLHRIPLWQVDPSVVHLTRAAGGGSARTRGRTVHTARLTAQEVEVIRGVQTTTVARTLVDLARSIPFESAVIATDYALHERLLVPSQLADALEVARHRQGNAAARRALAFADGRSESPGESRTRVLLHRLGHEPPQLQVDVFDRHGTFCGRTDLGYVEDATLLEFDGKVKYTKLLRDGQSPSDAVIEEKRREDAIRSVGTSVLRIIWAELGSADLVGRRVLEARRQGRALAVSGAFSGCLRPSPAIRIGA